jgi:hypothetical protein
MNTKRIEGPSGADLSKRELVELALRLTMRETPEEAAAAVEVELACLRSQGIV